MAGVLTGAVPYLHLAGTVLGGWQMAKAALKAEMFLEQGDSRYVPAFLKGRVATALFFAQHLLPLATAYAEEVTQGGASVTTLEDAFWGD